MTETTAPDANLGMPEELLREMASVDWHAGHRDAPHPTHPHPNAAVPAACVCASPEVIGDFAMRLITGQAQLSTTRDGKAVRVLGLTPTGERPLGKSSGDTSRPVLAGMVVHGDVIPVDHAPDCTNDEPHDCFRVEIRGLALMRHPKLDEDDMALLVVDALGSMVADRMLGEGEQK